MRKSLILASLLFWSSLFAQSSTIVNASWIGGSIGSQILSSNNNVLSEYFNADRSFSGYELSGYDVSIDTSLNETDSSRTSLVLDLVKIKGDTIYDDKIIDTRFIMHNEITEPEVSLKWASINPDTQSNAFIGLGFGYKDWNRISPDNTELNFKWSYATINGGGNYVFNNWFEIGIGAAYKYAILPEVELKNYSGSLVENLNQAYSFEFSFPIVFHISKKFSIISDSRMEITKGEFKSGEKINVATVLGTLGLSYKF
jgi:hypothetical protein